MKIDIINHKTQKAIKETVAFFDLFDYPLTPSEVYKYCFLESDLAKVEKELASMKTCGFINEKDNFYFLPKRDKIIGTRQRRKLHAKRKYTKAGLIVKIFKFIPWIKMIAIGNIIGEDNLKDNSDIDFFIVTKKKRIWLTRLFCNFVTQSFGLRPKEKNMRDKICLSFFVSEEEMNLEKLMLEDGQDFYFIYWMSGLKLIYDKDETWEKFKKANSWIYECLPNLGQDRKRLKEYSFDWFWCNFKKAVGLTFDRLDTIAGKFQIKILPKQIKEKMNKGTEVIINEKILKMHVNDRRAEYKNKFKMRL